MAGLLKEANPDDSPDRPRTRELIVDGELHANAAAKFWPALIDECAQEFPDCSMLALAAPTVDLHPGLLFPEQDLQRHLDKMMQSGEEVQWEDLLAEMELMGPPSPVEARLFAGRDEISSRSLPLESVDAESFAYLLAWALRWAKIPSAQWNESRLSGMAAALDPDRKRLYRLAFSLCRQPISEGLFRRSFYLVPSVQKKLDLNQ